MFKRLTTVSTAPVLIIFFMLFLAHLQPLDAGGLISGEAARTGRQVLVLLPYALAVLCLSIGIRFGYCGVMIAALSLGAAYLVTRHHGGAGFDMPGLQRAVVYALPAMLVPNYLLAAWTERVPWRSRRGIGALLLAAGWCLIVGGGQLRLFEPSAILALRLESLTQHMGAGIRSFLEALPAAQWAADHLPLAIDGRVMLWPTCLLLMIRAVMTRSPVLAGLGASLAVTVPPLVRLSGFVSLGLVYTAATLIVLVGVLESIFKRAYRDGLTDLPGRRSLDDTLRQLGRRYTIAMLDVDHFKRFNDRYGHATGDEVLKMIAARAGRIRGGQMFRYGGEEFAVVFRGRAADHAESAMEDFRRHLAQTPFAIRKRPRSPRSRRGRQSRRSAPGNLTQVKVTVSIGLAARAGRQRNAAAVLKAADKALYRAKRSGRNRLCREA